MPKQKTLKETLSAILSDWACEEFHMSVSSRSVNILAEQLLRGIADRLEAEARNSLI